jgi:hypothetical protein
MQKKKNLLVLDVYQERKIPKISFCFMISSFWDPRVGAGRQAGRERILAGFSFLVTLSKNKYLHKMHFLDSAWLGKKNLGLGSQSERGLPCTLQS